MTENKPVSGVKGVIKNTIDKGVKYTRLKTENAAVRTKLQALGFLNTTRHILYNALATLLTFILIISISVFMYGTFYYAYMPLEVHEESVNLQFEPCSENVGLCSFPNASVELLPKIKLMTGQPYSITLLLEVPDSDNNQALGMFMSCLHVFREDKALLTSCRSSIMEFRSELLRTLETFAFSPFLLAGTSSQRQWVLINYFKKYIDDPHLPASRMILEVKSKHLQVYRTTLLIHAEFSGLRHIMYHHPWISTTAGILSNVVILTLIILISWSRFFTDDELDQLQLDSELIEDLVLDDKDEMEIIKENIENIK